MFVAGLGGHAVVVASIARAAGFRVAGFLDALGEPRPGTQFEGLPVLGLAETLESGGAQIALGIGVNSFRAEIAERILSTSDAQVVSLFHPTSFREQDVEMGRHVTLCAGATLGTSVKVGDGALVNTGAIVDHECVLERYSHVCPGVKLAGRVRVGEYTQVGIGASVIEKVTIGAHAMIGAGAVVLEDVPDFSTAVGVPAKVVRTGRE